MSISFDPWASAHSRSLIYPVNSIGVIVGMGHRNFASPVSASYEKVVELDRGRLDRSFVSGLRKSLTGFSRCSGKEISGLLTMSKPPAFNTLILIRGVNVQSLFTPLR